MQLSPVWVLAIAADAAKGGQVFLNRLLHHLKEHDVIDESSNPESLEQILLSIHDMGRHGATVVDTPPLSIHGRSRGTGRAASRIHRFVAEKLGQATASLRSDLGADKPSS